MRAVVNIRTRRGRLPPLHTKSRVCGPCISFKCTGDRFCSVVKGWECFLCYYFVKSSSHEEVPFSLVCVSQWYSLSTLFTPQEDVQVSRSLDQFLAAAKNLSFRRQLPVMLLISNKNGSNRHAKFPTRHNYLGKIDRFSIFWEAER